MSIYSTATEIDTVQRKRKDNGVFVTHNVNIPPLIRGYNEHMGGVVLSDQLIQYYQVLRKSKK